MSALYMDLNAVKDANYEVPSMSLQVIICSAWLLGRAVCKSILLKIQDDRRECKDEYKKEEV